MSWTQQAVETVKTMWSDGASASEIASALGQDFSRSAVLGKVRRMKLPSNSAALRKGGRPFAKRTKKQRLDDARIVTTPRHRKESPPATHLIDPDDGVDVTDRMGLLDLDTHTCRFPIGDPLKPSFSFCGHQVLTKPDGLPASPYCPEHHSRAYHPQR